MSFIYFRKELQIVLQRKLDTTHYLQRSLVDGDNGLKNMIEKQAIQHAEQVAR
jgi:hypothetical protein